MAGDDGDREESSPGGSASAQDEQLEDPQNGDDPAELRHIIETLRRETQERAAQALISQEDTERLRAELAVALERYRQSILRAAPDLPEEMLGGATVAELEESLLRARQVVESVRSRLEAGQAHGGAPAGAPPRRGPDLSALSPQEKIAYGLERQRG